MNIEIWDETSALINSQQIERAIEFIEERLQKCETSHFKTLIGTEFKNSQIDVARDINGFIRFCEDTFDIEAVYLEMNGFDINTDEWYFDFFGYDEFITDREDLDWLAEWDSDYYPPTVLIGLEEVQKDFAWYNDKEGQRSKDIELAEELGVLLVFCKFTNFIKKVIQSGLIEKEIPIQASAHDFEIIARFNSTE